MVASTGSHGQGLANLINSRFGFDNTQLQGAAGSEASASEALSHHVLALQQGRAAKESSPERLQAKVQLETVKPLNEVRRNEVRRNERNPVRHMLAHEIDEFARSSKLRLAFNGNGKISMRHQVNPDGMLSEQTIEEGQYKHYRRVCETKTQGGSTETILNDRGHQVWSAARTSEGLIVTNNQYRDEKGKPGFDLVRTTEANTGTGKYTVTNLDRGKIVGTSVTDLKPLV